jgi:hypothetical protein
MSIYREPYWHDLAPHIRTERYGRRRAGEYRLEVSTFIPKATIRRLLAETTTCPSCGQIHHPVRERLGGGYYLAVACPEAVNPACKRSEAARLELDQLIRVSRDKPPSEGQGRLI